MVILDTNVIIDHLRRTNKDSSLVKIAKKIPKEALAISIISIQELYEGKSTKDNEREKYLLSTITPLRILAYTYEVAKYAGEIARDSINPIELADAAIAATAIINGYQLFTLNKKHFKGIKDLELIDMDTAVSR